MAAFPGAHGDDGGPVPPPAPAPLALDRQLDLAARLCERRGARLTDLRRQVLALVLAAGRPIGAYDLLDRLRAAEGGGRRGAAPPTIYRALDFLLDQGLIHKLQRLSAFVGCPVHDHDHAAQFLICRGCGAVAELDEPAVRGALTAAAAARGFVIAGLTIEAEGTCAACAARQPAPPAA